MTESCTSLRRELWACWPQSPTGHVAREALAHAAQCSECRAELDALRSLNRASTSPAGSPLGWSEVLPRRRWQSLAWSTRRALSAPAKKAAAPLPVPAFAAAALAAVVLFSIYPRPARQVTAPVPIPAPVPAPTPAPAPMPAPAPVADVEPAPPAQTLEELDMLAHLDLLENWTAPAAPQAEPGVAP